MFDVNVSPDAFLREFYSHFENNDELAEWCRSNVPEFIVFFKMQSKFLNQASSHIVELDAKLKKIIEETNGEDTGSV